MRLPENRKSRIDLKKSNDYIASRLNVVTICEERSRPKKKTRYDRSVSPTAKYAANTCSDIDSDVFWIPDRLLLCCAESSHDTSATQLSAVRLFSLYSQTYSAKE